MDSVVYRYQTKSYTLQPGPVTTLKLPNASRVLDVGLERTFGQTPERPVVLWVIEPDLKVIHLVEKNFRIYSSVGAWIDSTEEGWYLGTVQPSPGLSLHVFGDIPLLMRNQRPWQ